MKVLLWIALSMAGFSAFGQPLNCSDFKTGQFRMDDPSTGVNFIDRSDSIQIEHVPQLGVIVELNVEWIDDCTMVLSLKRVLENTESRPFNDFELISEIIHTTDSSYIMRSYIAGLDFVTEAEFFRME